MTTFPNPAVPPNRSARLGDWLRDTSENAGAWALDYLAHHAGQPEHIHERLGSLLQALGAASAYGRNSGQAVALALALHDFMMRAGLWCEWQPYLENALALARRAASRAESIRPSENNPRTAEPQAAPEVPAAPEVLAEPVFPTAHAAVPAPEPAAAPAWLASDHRPEESHLPALEEPWPVLGPRPSDAPFSMRLPQAFLADNPQPPADFYRQPADSHYQPAEFHRQPAEFHRRAEFSLLLGLGDALALRGEWQPALPWLEQAMQLEHHGGPQWVRPFARYAECQLCLGHPRRAGETLEHGLALAGQRGDDIAQTNLLGQLGRVRRADGDLPGAIACFNDALAAARRLQASDLITSNLAHLGVVYRLVGRLAEAEACLHAAHDWCLRLGEYSGQGVTLLNLSRVYLDMGDLERALCAGQAGLHIHRRLPNLPRLSVALACMAQLSARRGELTRALEYLDEAEKLVAQLDLPYYNALYHQAAAETWLARGQRQQALQSFQSARDNFQAAGDASLVALIDQRVRMVA